MAYLFAAFLILVGVALGAFGMFLWQFKKAKQDHLAYEHAKMELLDLQKELRDVAVEQISLCSDHVREIYATRQEDVIRYVNGTNASLQLVNELMGQFNSMLQVLPEIPATATTHMRKIQGIADEIRTLLNDIKFENLSEVIAAMELAETKALHNHSQLEQQQEKLNEPS